MPYKLTWYPAPKDESVVVLPVLPNKFYSIDKSWGVPYKQAKCYQTYYWCDACNGWVEGEPNVFRIDTMDSYNLSGRRGTQYCCRRCGEEVGFTGAVS